MYKIVGGDQKTYGPISREQVEQWIAEGRANRQTLCQAEGSADWKPLSAFPEFAGVFGAASSAPPPLGAPQPQYAAAPAEKKTNSMATAGLVLSLLGFFCCGPLVSTIALILSIVALNQISKNPYETGRGLAIAGIVISVLGYISFLVLLATGVFKGLLSSFPNF